jgi:hypothetical protein
VGERMTQKGRAPEGSFFAICKNFAGKVINNFVLITFLGYFLPFRVYKCGPPIGFIYNGWALMAENLTI